MFAWQIKKKEDIMIKQEKNQVIVNHAPTMAVPDLDNHILKMKLILKKYLICSLVVVYSNQECIVDIDMHAINIINTVDNPIKDNNTSSRMITQLAPY